MNIIIVGCGKVGLTLAKNLVEEKHNIILIDKDDEIIDKATSTIDCMGVVGNGAIQSVLLEAQVDKANFLVACTNSDEINILTCLIARKTSTCKTIARIRNPEYANQIDYIMNELDISMTVNPELATAHEIARISRYSQSISSDAFFKGRLNLLKVSVPDESCIIGLKLYEIAKEVSASILVCVIERGDELIIPTGSTTIEKGDSIFFVGEHSSVIQFFSKIGISYKPLNTFMIVGGGKITQYLISILSHYVYKTNIKVIDKDIEICKELAEKFKDISVVCADASDKSVLVKEGMNDVDAFITLTGIDEENIILSLFASLNQNVKIITKINHLNFIDSLKEIKLGSMVNPERIASNIMVSYVRASMNAGNSNIETLYRLCNDRIEGLGFKIKSKTNITGVQLKDLKIKPNVLICGIFRRGKVIIPKGNDTIEVGDSVVIITKDNKFKDIIDIVVE